MSSPFRVDALVYPAVADGVIEQYALLKQSGSTDRRLVVFGTADTAGSAAGIAATAAAGAGSTFDVCPTGPSRMVSDGTTVIARGDAIEPSATVAGRVRKGTTNQVAIANSGAAAVNGTVFDVTY